MPNNKRHTKKQMQGTMADVHPSSRRAGQLDRIVLRKNKLTKAKNYAQRAKGHKLERPIFFHLSLPPAPFEAYDLPSLHELIKDVYLTRNDEELDELKKARRPGRPKAKREIEIEEIKRKENAEYENGFELPDLLHPPTVELLRSWNTGDPAFLDLMRFIRLSTKHPESIVVAKKGLGVKVAEEGVVTGLMPEGSAAAAAEEGSSSAMEVEEPATSA